MFYVYLIVNLLNNKMYVGKTNNPHKRWLQHKNIKSANSYKSAIKNAIALYGTDNFTFQILEEFDSELNSYKAEINWIEFLKTNNFTLYNLTIGGEGFASGPNSYWYGKSLPIEMREKISISRTGKYGDENNPMFGRHHSLSSKSKISNKNKKISDKIVEEIKELSLTGNYSGVQLSKMFNISKSQISRIINKKRRTIS